METNKYPLFDPKTYFSGTGKGRTASKYEINQAVFSQGDVADAVYYVESGKIKVTVISEQGKEAVIAMIGAGDLCGEQCLMGQVTRTTAATAMSDCVLFRVETAIVVRLVHDDVAFAEWVIAYLLKRNVRVESDLIDQLFNSTEKRLARLLLTLASFGKEGMPEPNVPMISQETMAEMIGATRPRVNFFLNRFRLLGFIDYNGTLTVRNSLLSVLLSDQPRIKS